MKLSTHGRYGMRVMLTLAVHYDRGPMYLKDIAEAEEISEKYLSLLVIPLRQAGLIHSIRGAYGGYTLAKAPSQINLGEIVEVLEGDSIVDCLKDPFCLSPGRRVQKPRHLGLSWRENIRGSALDHPGAMVIRIGKETEGQLEIRETGTGKKTRDPVNRIIGNIREYLLRSINFQMQSSVFRHIYFNDFRK